MSEVDELNSRIAELEEDCAYFEHELDKLRPLYADSVKAINTLQEKLKEVLVKCVDLEVDQIELKKKLNEKDLEVDQLRQDLMVSQVNGMHLASEKRIHIQEQEIFNKESIEKIKELESKLRASEWVRKDAALRTYDGLTTKVDEYEAALQKFAAAELETMDDLSLLALQDTAYEVLVKWKAR